MDLTATINYLVPFADCDIDGGNYKTIAWRDKRPMPTWAEVRSAMLKAEESRSAKYEIRHMEDTITPRRIREAVLTKEGKEWLDQTNGAISALRKLL